MISTTRFWRGIASGLCLACLGIASDVAAVPMRLDFSGEFGFMRGTATDYPTFIEGVFWFDLEERFAISPSIDGLGPPAALQVTGDGSPLLEMNAGSLATGGPAIRAFSTGTRWWIQAEEDRHTPRRMARLIVNPIQTDPALDVTAVEAGVFELILGDRDTLGISPDGSHHHPGAGTLRDRDDSRPLPRRFYGPTISRPGRRAARSSIPRWEKPLPERRITLR